MYRMKAAQIVTQLLEGADGELKNTLPGLPGFDNVYDSARHAGVYKTGVHPAS